VSRRALPTLVAGSLALAYVIVAPRSSDLAAELLRARLFGAEGFGLWDNWWYGGHYTLSYSVLFPALAWLTTPQLVAAIAVTLSAAAFEALAYGRFGAGSWLGSVWFAAATATILLSGRLAFAAGLAPALAAALALQRRAPLPATILAALSALLSPVAALFAALAGAAYALGSRSRTEALAGAAVVAAALAPVVVIAVIFGGGGREPFALSAFWPIPLLALGALLALAPEQRTLRAGVVLYALGCALAYLLPTPVGGNAARLAALLAGPLAALLWWPRHAKWLAIAAVPLLYLQWQAAVRDLSAAARDPSTTAAYYRPLLRFLDRQGGPPFRIEIPFTAEHWEAYEVAPRFALARGWERQLDEGDNALFYRGTLSASSYEGWLDRLAVRFVAVPDVALDHSGQQEARLIERGLPYLVPVLRTTHWHVYAVVHARPIVQGTARLVALGPDSLTIRAAQPGRSLVAVRWTPYWKLSGPASPGGCVAPAGSFTQIMLRHQGTVRLVIAFALDRIGSRSPRCR
jgi:hypothetical protein